MSKERFVKVSTALRDDGVMAELKGAPLAVFLAIALHVDRRGECWPGMTRLAKLTGFNRSSVSRAVGRLEELGLLTVRRRPRPRTNLYIVNRYAEYGHGEWRDPEVSEEHGGSQE